MATGTTTSAMVTVKVLEKFGSMIQNKSRSDLQQRQRAQIAEEVSQPETADGNGHDHVRDGDGESLGKIRFDDPEQIQIAHQHEPHCQPHQLANVAFEGARQQSSERDGKVEDHNEQADVSPAAVQTPQIIRDLRRQIASPDDEPLRVVEVSPDHHKGKHPFAMVVDEVGLQHLRHGLVIKQNALDYNREAHSRQDFANENDQAEDGGNPAGIERHHPVN